MLAGVTSRSSLSELGRLIERLVDQIRTLRPPPLWVGIFGSLARNEGDSDSDEDLPIVRSRSVKPHGDEIGLLAEMVRAGKALRNRAQRLVETATAVLRA